MAMEYECVECGVLDLFQTWMSVEKTPVQLVTCVSTLMAAITVSVSSLYHTPPLLDNIYTFKPHMEIKNIYSSNRSTILVLF